MENIKTFIEKIHNAYKLKNEYRYSWKKINWNKDSVASHSWNMLILADYFINYLNEISPWKYNLDKLKIYEYIIYHDLVEAEVWDIDNNPDKDKIRLRKEENEQKWALILSKKLPIYIWDNFINNFTSFEKREDIESKFTKIMDIFEWVLNCYYDKEIWSDWSKNFYKRKYFRNEFESFPELKEINIQIYESLVKKWYLKN